MKKNSIDLSDRLDPEFFELAEIITHVTGTLSIPFFLIGAKCRDLILEYLHDIDTIRATGDVDFAVCISNWSHFEELKKALLATEAFNKTRLFQRLNFKSSLLVDLVPFGPVSGRNKKYSWPSKPGTTMSTIGFEEAYENSIPVIIRSAPPLPDQSGHPFRSKVDSDSGLRVQGEKLG